MLFNNLYSKFHKVTSKTKLRFKVKQVLPDLYQLQGNGVTTYVNGDNMRNLEAVRAGVFSSVIPYTTLDLQEILK